MSSAIQPVLLGSDFNVYGMARAFHEAYGVTSIALSSAQLSPTEHSSIVNVTVHASFTEPDTFIKTLRQFIHDHQSDQETSFILIACGDRYVELVTMFLKELSLFFICPYVSQSLQQRLENKRAFYQLCHEMNLPCPDSHFVTPKDASHIDDIVDNLPFDYPVILKPSHSITYQRFSFPGKKKAYVIDTPQELKTTLSTIYRCGYLDDMIIQDMIPGDDTNMRVLNTYVDQYHRVRLMCLGQAVLEDPSPNGVGNYLAIVPDYNDDIYTRIQQFLETIKYTGFANIDMKYDARDGQYKLFELNLRQGRSSYFVTLNGYNLATYVVDDYVHQAPFTSVTYGRGHAVWLGAPPLLIRRYVTDKQLAHRVTHLHQQGQYGYTAIYTQDLSFRRWLQQTYSLYRYFLKFKRHYRKRTS